MQSSKGHRDLPPKTNRSAQLLKLSDGRMLCYAEYGDPQGKPLLYFHGGPGSRLDMAPAEATFLEHGIRMIAPDRPGMGQSDRKGNRTLLDWADDIAELIDHLNLHRPSI